MDLRRMKIGTLLTVGIVVIITLMISASFYSTYLSNKGLTIVRHSTTRIFDVLTIQRDTEELFSDLDGLDIVLNVERLEIEANKIEALQKRAEATIKRGKEENIFNQKEASEAENVLHEVSILSNKIIESRKIEIQKDISIRDSNNEIKKDESFEEENLFNTLRNTRFRMLSVFNDVTIRSDEEFGDAMDLVRRAQQITWIVVGISLGLAVLLGYYLVKSVKKIFDLKNEFVNIIAHDLRNPVTAIIGYLQILDDNKNKKIYDLKDSFQALFVSAQKLRTQISNLLEVGRSEAGRMKLNLEQVDPFKVIEDSLLRANALADISGISIVHKKDKKTDIFVLADRNKLSDVLDNLISNAIKYNSKKGNVTVTTKYTSEYFIISVTDTGEGIPEDQKHKIFKRYSRLDTDKEKKVGGTGLGLYTVKLSMDKMNGMASFVSKENVGTTFTISLKIADKNYKTKTSSK